MPGNHQPKISTRKSATTRFGTEMPASEPTRMSWSVRRLARSAESTPSGTPMTMMNSRATTASWMVAGSRSAMTAVTAALSV